MVAVHTFATSTKNYFKLNYMIKDKKGFINTNKGEMDFLVQILLFILVIFVIWVFTNGPSHYESQKPFIKPLVNEQNPGQIYGPSGN